MININMKPLLTNPYFSYRFLIDAIPNEVERKFKYEILDEIKEDHVFITKFGKPS